MMAFSNNQVFKTKIDTKKIVFKPKKKINYKIKNIDNLEKITQIFFSGKRKMINKPFSKIFKNYEEVAKSLNIDLNKRPSELNYENYYNITEKYEKIINKKNINYYLDVWIQFFLIP